MIERWKICSDINSIIDLMIELQGKTRLQDELRAVLQSRFLLAVMIGCAPASIQAPHLSENDLVLCSFRI